MKYNPDIHHRRSIRLRNYDYTRAGAYFVTICVQHRECLFGEITDGDMRLNAAGNIVAEQWIKTGNRDTVESDAWTVMPNHFHGIIVLTDTAAGRGTARRAPTCRVSTTERFGKPVAGSLPTDMNTLYNAGEF